MLKVMIAQFPKLDFKKYHAPRPFEESKLCVEGTSAQMFLCGSTIHGLDVFLSICRGTWDQSNAEGGYFGYAALLVFLAAVGICTFLLGSIQPSKVVNYFSQNSGNLFTAGAIFLPGMTGTSYSLVAISFCHVVDVSHHLWIALEGLGRIQILQQPYSRHGPCRGRSNHNHGRLTRNDPDLGRPTE